MTAPVTHILPHSNIRRVRLLPALGSLTAHINQKVNSGDVIAEMPMAYRHTLVDVWRGLGLAPGETADTYLRCKVGMRVMQGDVLAETGGLFTRIMRAPMDGEVVAIGGGRIMIQHLTLTYYLQAGIPGRVLELIEDRGVIIEANGALLQGVWGNGLINSGPLVFAANAPGEPLTSGSFNKSALGSVALGGHCSSADALKKAVDMGLKGLILGSITADLVPAVNALGFPVILLEGFGRLPINTFAFKILSLHKGEEIVMNAEKWDPFTGSRPEAFIPIEGTGQLAAESDEFTPGQMVRLHGPKYETLIGEVSRVEKGMIHHPGGLRARSALIQLETGEQLTYPLLNLDVVE